jgi:hypothetical protein
MPKGGARKGAGRPLGTGPYGEKTVIVRLPVSLADQIITWCRIFCNEGERDILKTYKLYEQAIKESK